MGWLIWALFRLSNALEDRPFGALLFVERRYYRRVYLDTIGKMPLCTIRTNKSDAEITGDFMTRFPHVVAEAVGKPVEVS